MHDTMAPSSLTEPDVAAASSESSTRDRFYSILRKPASNLALRISDLDRYRLNMWEVSWAAPKESRKEHRENKAATGKSATKARSIFSRGSNSSSEAPSFGNFYNKRKNAERGNDSVSSTSSKAPPAACRRRRRALVLQHDVLPRHDDAPVGQAARLRSAAVCPQSARCHCVQEQLHHLWRRWQQPEIPQRYGTANAPPEHLGGWKELGPHTRRQQTPEHKELPKIGENLQKDANPVSGLDSGL